MSITEKSYAAIAETLKEFDIRGFTDDLLCELEEEFSHLPPEIMFNKAAALLSAVGEGVIDRNTWTWTPAQNGVYAFDVEVFDEGSMYTFFLRGIAALDPDLNFTNIQEDVSAIDWYAESRAVTFDWKGASYTLEMENMGDWFDPSAANQLNQIVRANGEKRLFFASDGYQECIVFYREPSWVEDFQQKTGLALSDTIS